MKNELYVVKDVPWYSEDVSNYCYVVKAVSYDEAIEIVKKKKQVITGNGKLRLQTTMKFGNES